VLARIDEVRGGQYRLADWRVLEPDGPRGNEKNWMPVLEPASAEAGDQRLRFICLCDPMRVVDEAAQVIAETAPVIAAEQFRGGTQAIGFDGGLLALIHEVVEGSGDFERFYHHRFVWFDKSCLLRRVSRPFFLNRHGEEIATGLARHPDCRRLVISYRVGEREAWVATIDPAEVRTALEDIERLPWGAPPRAGNHRAAMSSEILASPAAAAAPPVCPAASRATATLPIFVISLDRTPARLAEFYRRNAHLTEVKKFRAVDGRPLIRQQLIRDGTISADCIYTPGNLGCAMSHFALWRRAAEEGRAITVAEDDAIFSRNFTVRAQGFLQQLPEDWDFVQWGWVFQQRVWVQAIPQIVNATMIFDQDELRRHIDDFQSEDTAPVPIRLLHSFGTVCYSVSPKGAEALLKHCTPISGRLIEFPGFGVTIENKGVDCLMNGAYPSLKTFLSLPPLVATEHREEDTTTREGGLDRWLPDAPPEVRSGNAQFEPSAEAP
jgi:GR25 family glycosyltransferase involved in LPS biosynthesis